MPVATVGVPLIVPVDVLNVSPKAVKVAGLPFVSVRAYVYVGVPTPVPPLDACTGTNAVNALVLVNV